MTSTMEPTVAIHSSSISAISKYSSYANGPTPSMEHHIRQHMNQQQSEVSSPSSTASPTLPSPSAQTPDKTADFRVSKSPVSPTLTSDSQQTFMTKISPPRQGCENCHTLETPMWRRDSEGRTVCNACGE
ncbi:hypothetical protein GYMLUDRAFT_40037 [Collybiopsis luxurians FD-317 M1]|nr:hypothetical protein GYMLUDRAFT_40037 [Collybiopsis luxurians FD-317 M1]